jgi:hypothetical protein
MYMHFSCQVGFRRRGTDEVTVHLLEGDDLLFISAVGSQP